MNVREPTAWVVYRMGILRGAIGRGVVCTQDEWNRMEASRPGLHTLVRAHIENEGEAERLARGVFTPPERSPSTRLTYSAIRLAVRAERSG